MRQDSRHRTVVALLFCAGVTLASASPGAAISTVSPATPGRWFVSVTGATGIFGYYNMNGIFFPGSLSLGATANAGVRIDRYFHIGSECMMLWCMPDTSHEARFIMNVNLRLQLSVPVHPKWTVEALVSGGFSIWPVQDAVSPVEPTFYSDRFGWNTQPALGVVYKINGCVSLALSAGYLANTTNLREIVITHDMMLVTAGPRVVF